MIMKKTIGTLIAVCALIILPIYSAMAAPPPPPPDLGSGHVFIGGAPIGNGLLILVALGLAYGAKRLYDSRKKKIVE
jgi:hypothetical protein